MSITVNGQRERKITGEFQYLVPGYMSLDEAKMTAIEKAKVNALAKEFGTIISETSLILMDEANNRSNSSFYSQGVCDVKGEWLKTIEEDIKEEMADGCHWITAKVKGIARELKFAKVKFDARLLRNGKEDEYEDEDFHDGDRFYISFRSPTKGYLSIYLLDAERNAYPIVPEKDAEMFLVNRGERYVFVDNDKEDLILTAAQPLELNQVYIIFSPNRYYLENVEKGVNDASLTKYRTQENDDVFRLPYVPFKNFQKWISKLRIHDPEMQVITRLITIRGERSDM